MVASVNVPVRLAAWSRASFSWLRTILNEGMQKRPKRVETRKEREAKGRGCGGTEEAEEWRAQTTSGHGDNERPRWPDSACRLGRPLSAERAARPALSPLLRAVPDWVAAAAPCAAAAAALLCCRCAACSILTPRFCLLQSLLGRLSFRPIFSRLAVLAAQQVQREASDQRCAVSREGRPQRPRDAKNTRSA